MNIQTEHREDYENGTSIFRTTVGREALMNELPYTVFREVVKQVADVIAKKILEERMAEILEKITPSAIASMAIAEAAAAVNETLHKKMPDKIIEIEKRSQEVWLQPFFGRARRIK